MTEGKKNSTEGSYSASIDEQKVWESFMTDDPEALSEIFRVYSNKLYNYCRQFTPDDALIWDVIQDQFYDLIRRKKNLTQPNSVLAYLLSSVRRKLVSRLQHDKRVGLQSFDPDRHAFQIQISKENELIDSELTRQQKDVIEKACNELPVKQREAILLRFYEGLSYEEIAEIMGMTKNKSARALVYRGLASLSSKLSPFDPKKGLALLYTIAMV